MPTQPPQRRRRRILALSLVASAGLAAGVASLRAAEDAPPAAPEYKSPTPPSTQPYCESGFTPIFNGKDLAGWVYGTKGNAMKQGVGYQVDADQGIVYSTVKDGGNLYTEKEYADFVLRFDFKLSENANNGIGIRAPLEGDSAYAGMEIQVLDDYGPMYKQMKIRPAQYHGAIYDCFAPETGYQKPVGEWNTEEIMAQGRHVRIVLNSHVIVDANLDDIKDEAKLKKHPGLANKTGHIGFLGHGARVEFRNLRVKELTEQQ